MKMKNLFLAFFASSLFILGFTACSDDDNDKQIKSIVTNLEFTDKGSTPEFLKGVLTWKRPIDISVEKLVIYLSKDGVSKGTKIGEVSASAERFDIPESTAYASNILVVSVLGTGIEDIHTASISPDKGVFILNSGKNGSNNASLSLYNETTGGVTYKVFATANGKGLGDTGQSMVVYGSKVYVAVYGSNVIYVLDKSGKILGEIKATREGQPQQPRNLTAYNGKVYSTLYDGYLARIDTTKLSIEAQVKVGRNPEYVKAANNKLYVANSGGMDYNTAVGYDKTVSVVDVKSFKELTKLDVVLNPEKLSDPDSDGDIYLISNGNYGDVPNTLQRIDTKNDKVYSVTAANATWMSLNNDKLYLIHSQYDAKWNQTISYMVYDTKNEKLITDKFITDGTAVTRPYSISTNPANGNVYIGTSDYKTNGDMYVFTSAGKLIKKFDTGGLNPMGAYFLNN